jgi:hypothetical protein
MVLELDHIQQEMNRVVCFTELLKTSNMLLRPQVYRPGH